MGVYIIVGVIAIINLLGFFLMGADKRRSRKKLWRVPEKTFFLVALFGGSIGVYLGMQLFRHKTEHWYFSIGVPVIFIAELVIIYFIFYY